MNNVVQNGVIRKRQYRRNIDNSCKNIKKYAMDQNTTYNPMTNQILYGINTNLRVSGVSDGTCNQIDPLIFTPRYRCGAGAAGGNPCVYDTIENFNSNCNGCNTTEFVIFLLIVLMLIGIIYSKNNSI